MTAKSKHALDGDIVRFARGVAIYKTHASPFWIARIRDNSTHKYIVRSTKETSRVKARIVAEEFAADLTSRQKAVPREFSFKHFATLFMEKGRRLVETGERNANYMRTARLFLDNDEWGLMRHFAERDVRELRTRDYFEFMNSLARKRSDLSASTRNMLSATFRNVLKVARDEGVIDEVPATPRTRQKDNPRPFFRFHPLVPKERDAYRKLLDAAKEMAAEEQTHSRRDGHRRALRPDPVRHPLVRSADSTELYAIRHTDVEVADNPKRLLLTVRNGKTGFSTRTRCRPPSRSTSGSASATPSQGRRTSCSSRTTPTGRRPRGSSSGSSTPRWTGPG